MSTPTLAELQAKLTKLAHYRAAESEAELARWVIMDCETCEALAFDHDEAGKLVEVVRVPVWHATRFPRRPLEQARAHGPCGGKCVRLGDMYEHWIKKLQFQLDEVQAPAPEHIRATRTQAGLTQEQAAHMVCLGTRSRWNEYEQGIRPIDPARWELFLIKTGRHERFGPVQASLFTNGQAA
jgi:hypothetical protein